MKKKQENGKRFHGRKSPGKRNLGDATEKSIEDYVEQLLSDEPDLSLKRASNSLIPALVLALSEEFKNPSEFPPWFLSKAFDILYPQTQIKKTQQLADQNEPQQFILNGFPSPDDPEKE